MGAGRSGAGRGGRRKEGRAGDGRRERKLKHQTRTLLDALTVAQCTDPSRPIGAYSCRPRSSPALPLE